MSKSTQELSVTSKDYGRNPALCNHERTQLVFLSLKKKSFVLMKNLYNLVFELYKNSKQNSEI